MWLGHKRCTPLKGYRPKMTRLLSDTFCGSCDPKFCPQLAVGFPILCWQPLPLWMSGKCRGRAQQSSACGNCWVGIRNGPRIWIGIWRSNKLVKWWSERLWKENDKNDEEWWGMMRDLGTWCCSQNPFSMLSTVPCCSGSFTLAKWLSLVSQVQHVCSVPKTSTALHEKKLPLESLVCFSWSCIKALKSNVSHDSYWQLSTTGISYGYLSPWWADPSLRLPLTKMLMRWTALGLLATKHSDHGIWTMTRLQWKSNELEKTILGT